MLRFERPMIEAADSDQPPPNAPSGSPARPGVDQPRSSVRALLRFWRPVLLALLCLGATFALAPFLDRFTPIASWMAWKVGLIWFWALVLAAACLGLGNAICRRLWGDAAEGSALERQALAIPLGAIAFGVLMYAAGVLHLFHAPLAVLLPLLGIAVGLGRSPAQRLARLRAARFVVNARDLPVILFGLLSVALILLHVFHPDAPNHDAHWTHVVIAQDYAREGHVIEQRGEWARNFPHFASLFYTWAFLVPGLTFPLRMLLVMHVELLFLLGTLVGVSAGARWLAPATDGDEAKDQGGSAATTAWVSFFLFPSIFVYDSDLGGSADHVAALFAVPMFLAIVRGTERFSPALCAVGGAMAGAVFITKYQSAYLITPLALLVAFRLAREAWRRWRGGAQRVEDWQRAWLATRWMLLGGILAASPLFLENLYFHHNPLYPFLQKVFTGSRPTFANAPFLVSHVLTPGGLRGDGLTLSRQLLDSLGLVFGFSFHPHYSFLGERPYVGFLFTLLSPLVVLLARAQRLRIGALMAGGAVFAWAMTYLVDRNLQIIMPMLVAVTAGIIIAVWRTGWIARVGLVPLLLLQVAWGGDLMFQGYLAGAIEHIRNGIAGKVDVRETLSRKAMNRLIPRNGVLVMHAGHVSLGVDREVLSDEIGSQGLFDYSSLRTRRELYDRFRAVGATHVAWVEGAEPGPHIQRDIVFYALVKALPSSSLGPYSMVELPATPPPATPPYRVLSLGIGGHADGIYPVDEISRCEMQPPGCVPAAPAVAVQGPATAAILDAGVDAAIVAPSYPLDPAVAAVLDQRFQRARAGAPYTLYLRSR